MLLIVMLNSLSGFAFTQNKSIPIILWNQASKIINLKTANNKLALEIDYSNGCRIRKLIVNGRNTLSSAGAYTGYTTKTTIATSSGPSDKLSPATQVRKNSDGITITGINYGDAEFGIKEIWKFKIIGNKINWEITRDYDQILTLEDIAFPIWNFASLETWKGGIIDNGGMVWCKYLSKPQDTYSVHTAGTTFWNADSGDGLSITAKSKGNQLASKYAQNDRHEFTFTQLVTKQPLQQRYNLSRFVSGKHDVFAAFDSGTAQIKATFELEYIDYFEKYSRGKLPGIDASALRELMNTTGRYGVVDKNIIGANGWLTNWKCLHEPFFAQIGMALNDQNYTNNMATTLDQERDQAMLEDGRVLSRWHNAAGDEIPGTYNAKTGYYEAMWGYTIDSQTGYLINVAEQFDLSGDLGWLKKHQVSCEKALDWLIKRDSNQNGIFEMKNNSIADKNASDWLDIVWASFENAFVNAQMYEALKLWSDCERILGNEQKAAYYSSVAQRLKLIFNKPILEGGFWSPEKNQYVYWRDSDGSIHGDNMVTPLNFAAIAFGICDEPSRISSILDQIEKKTTAERLFHWPLCFESFQRAEVEAGNWPFPRYENGDIFPTWGYLGVRAYAKYDKNIALKYVSNLLKQYEKDGLSSQRYSRTTQLGLGDDVLAGICTSITGLYRDIYGVRPKWNRMGLEPNMTRALAGTQFSYNLRGKIYQLKLSENNYQMSGSGFKVTTNEAFGISKNGQKVMYFPKNDGDRSLVITNLGKSTLDMTVTATDDGTFQWVISSSGTNSSVLQGMVPGKKYQLLIDKSRQTLIANQNGSLVLPTSNAKLYKVFNYQK